MLNMGDFDFINIMSYYWSETEIYLNGKDYGI